MQWRWPVLAACLVVLAVACAKNSQRNYETEAAPGFLFWEHPFHFDCTDRYPGKPLPPGVHSYVTVSPQIPYSYTRLNTLDLPRSQVPALTLATENGAFIRVSIQGGRQDDWKLQFCAQGEGNSEAEARGYLSTVAMNRTGSLVTLDGGRVGSIGPGGPPGGRGNLLVDAPADAPVTVDSSSGAIAVHDMDGPVRLTAPHARITILNTTGRVDASGGIVDFAGSNGAVMATATMEADIKITAQRFDGKVSAYAIREARVLVPKGFQTPMELTVRRAKDFICRADICKAMQSKKNGDWMVFTFAGDGGATTDHVSVQSESSTVVVDNPEQDGKFPWSIPDRRADKTTAPRGE
jgi:hypothetical protein